MNKTTNYHLPQWEASDPVRREEFNEAFAALDGVYSPSNKPYVIGQYNGTGSDPLTINLGFRPSVLIVSSPETTGLFNYSIITDGKQMTYRLAFTDAGFTVYIPSSNSGSYPNLNAIRTYFYIAFR